MNLKKYVAECFGTFVLVLVACGVAAQTGGSLVATSLAFGLVIVAMAYSIGDISGCHINPAVSLAMFINKKLSAKDFGFYVLAQFIGAILGAVVLALCLGTLGADKAAVLGGNVMQLKSPDWWPAISIATYYPVYVGIIVETILTFIFVYLILSVTSKKENSKVAGIVIGLTLTLVHLVGIGFTGTSVNPARSFGPALIQAFTNNTEALKQIWIFIIFPLLGGALAALAWKYFGQEENKNQDGSQSESESK